jgi:hypothetical protein
MRKGQLPQCVLNLPFLSSNFSLFTGSSTTITIENADASHFSLFSSKSPVCNAEVHSIYSFDGRMISNFPSNSMEYIRNDDSLNITIEKSGPNSAIQSTPSFSSLSSDSSFSDNCSSENSPVSSQMFPHSEQRFLLFPMQPIEDHCKPSIGCPTARNIFPDSRNICSDSHKNSNIKNGSREINNISLKSSHFTTLQDLESSKLISRSQDGRVGNGEESYCFKEQELSQWFYPCSLLQTSKVLKGHNPRSLGLKTSYCSSLSVLI